MGKVIASSPKVRANLIHPAESGTHIGAVLARVGSVRIDTVRDPFSASLDYRRRHIRDLTWLGMGLVAIGFGVFAQARAWPRLLSVAII